MASAEGHDPQWLQGFAAGIAAIDRTHDRPSFVVDAMHGYGITVEDLKRARVEPFDLASIRRAMKGATKR